MRGKSRALTAWALVLACLALAMRIAAPQGYMPALADAEGGAPIVLCTSQGLVAVSPDGAGGPTDPADGEPGRPGHEGPCAFAALGPALSAPPAGQIEAPADLAPAPGPAWSLAEGPGPGLLAPPPPQTGPPLRA